MNLQRVSAVLPVVLAIFIALVVGILGLWAVFTDIGPRDSITARWLTTGLVYAVGATAVGLLAPRRWYLALLTAWGPFLMGLIGLTAKLIKGGPVPYWRFLALTLLGVPGIALIFGYLGRIIRGPMAIARWTKT